MENITPILDSLVSSYKSIYNTTIDTFLPMYHEQFTLYTALKNQITLLPRQNKSLLISNCLQGGVLDAEKADAPLLIALLGGVGISLGLTFFGERVIM